MTKKSYSKEDKNVKYFLNIQGNEKVKETLSKETSWLITVTKSFNMRKRKWPQHNKSLVQRESIIFWIDEKFHKTTNFRESTKGRPKFKPAIIHTGWILKTTYHLDL